jgi:hypothetical protein
MSQSQQDNVIVDFASCNAADEGRLLSMIKKVIY